MNPSMNIFIHLFIEHRTIESHLWRGPVPGLALTEMNKVDLFLPSERSQPPGEGQKSVKNGRAAVHGLTEWRTGCCGAQKGV